MRRLAQWRSWLRSILNRSRVEAEMDAELRWHYETCVEQLLSSGLPEYEARRRARLELGDIEIQKENCRDSLGLRAWDEVRNDLRFGLRALFKNRLLTINLILTLILGIGISSGVFNCVSSIFLQPWISSAPSSYVAIFSFFTMDPARPMEQASATLEDYLALRGRARSLRELAGFARFDLDFKSDDMESTITALVSDNFFSVYGVDKAELGRLLEPQDFSKSSAVVVLSEELWRDRFAADPSIIGKTIPINDHPVTVVGVVAPILTGDSDGKAWLPYTLTDYLGLGDQRKQPGDLRWLGMSGRLNSGFSRSDASAELAALIRQQDLLHRGRISQLVVTDGSGLQQPGRNEGRWLFFLIVGVLVLVLLISCANVTTLLLSRADARQAEVAVRLALGASRIRLVRMLMTETILISVIAGGLSVYLTYHVPGLIWSWLTVAGEQPRVGPDWRVFAYLTASTLLAGLLAGLAPALESLKVDLLGALKGQRRFFTRRTSNGGLRQILVGAQVAISLVLLVGSSLFIHAYREVARPSPGYDYRQLVLATVFDPAAKTQQARAVVRDKLVRQFDAFPGVRSSAFASSLQPSMDAEQLLIQLPGKALFPVASLQVSANYFPTMDIPILRGRALEKNDADCDRGVVCSVVVSQRFAREFLDADDVIGKTLRTSTGQMLEIAGVSGNVSGLFDRIDTPVIYRPWNPANFPVSVMALVRVTGNATAMASSLTDVLKKSLPGSKVKADTIEERVEWLTTIFWRLQMMILLLGVMALFLSVIGIYGVVSFAVGKRMKEIGIRIALGAVRKDIYVTLLRSHIRPVWIGLLVGIPLAVGGARVLFQALHPAEHLFAFNSPLHYLEPACLLFVVSIVAILIPARRAAHCDPSTTLRDE